MKNHEKYNKDLHEKHKTIFLADIDDDEDFESSTEDLLLLSTDNDDSDESYTRLDIVDDIDSKRDNDFVRFAESTNLEEILYLFHQVKSSLGLQQSISSFKEIFPVLLNLSPNLPHRYSELLNHLYNKSQHKEYKHNSVANGHNVLIIGKKI